MHKFTAGQYERVLIFVTSGNSLPSLQGMQIEYRPLAGIKAGCVHLCRVVGNTV